MANADDGLAALKRIRSEFADFCKGRGHVTEADTRAQVIDRVLEEVCGWPRNAIDRERYTRLATLEEQEEYKKRGYIDYCLTPNDKALVCVEAKREGIPFVLPHDTSVRSLKLSGVLSKIPEVREAILQVRGYCDSEAIRFAVATNGYTWIVFRAVRDDIPWRDGEAKVFPSLEHIEEHFVEFWNLLSFGAILSGSLLAEFGSPLRTSRELFRVTDRLFNADLPLERNRLHYQLEPIIKTFFADIGDQEQVRILQSCYVYSGSLKTAARDLSSVISDAIPKLLKEQQTEEISQTRSGTGRWGQSIFDAVIGAKGEVFLLLGRIGSGKTTFLRRYQRTVASDLLERQTFWFHVSFLGALPEPSALETEVYGNVLRQLREKYKAHGLERRKNIIAAFQDEIDALDQTALGALTKGSQEYERQLSVYLAKWQENTAHYVPRLLRELKRRQRKGIIVFLDNVDQLSPAYQAQIFMLAQRIATDAKCVSVIALREESYYTPSANRVFSAYANSKFHIASPRFRRLIGNRIDLALDVLTRNVSGVAIRTATELDSAAIVDFLKIVQFSIFQQNRNIARFIEAVCFGNMRSALQMFATFLTSGATDVDKMLRYYRRDGAYYVAFHEFVKSIMLGERQYYKESHSPILNVFDCGAEKNSSHFTALRLLEVLLGHQGEDSSEGRGYIEVARVATMFEDVFDNREDFLRTANRLVERQLVEVNTRSTKTIDGATHLRATSAGWYYARHLVNSFAYLDLVLQDTPLNDAGVERLLRDSVDQVDNLSGRDEDRAQRTEVRFKRVQAFLEYLQHEETRERSQFGLSRLRGLIGTEFVKEVRSEFEHQRDWIRRRIQENRERYLEDLLVGSGDGPFGGEYETEEDAQLSLPGTPAAKASINLAGLAGDSGNSACCRSQRRSRSCQCAGNVALGIASDFVDSEMPASEAR